MNYKFNGRNLYIPDAELDKSVELLDISLNEAIQMWLEDNGYLDNAEVDALTEKAKQNKVKLNAQSSKPRKTTKRERKPDEEKEMLISLIAKCLTNAGFSANITNVSKIIEFNIGNNHYKLDLIKQRPPKDPK